MDFLGLFSQNMGSKNPDAITPSTKDQAVIAEAVDKLMEESIAPKFGEPAEWMEILYDGLSDGMLKRICAEDGWQWLLGNLWRFLPVGTVIQVGILIKEKPIIGMWLKAQYTIMQKWYQEDEGGQG